MMASADRAFTRNSCGSFAPSANNDSDTAGAMIKKIPAIIQVV